MKLIKKIVELENTLFEARKSGKSIGLVPTMGALHEGHASLVKKCSDENDITVVSVFLNPTQFNDPKDLERYPRDLDADCALCEANGATIVFAPSVEEVYPTPDTRQLDFPPVTTVMEGAKRPGHFNGVCQVVSRLFYITKPDKAYFGEKDAQQLAVIKRMVKDLNMDIEIVGCPIIREADGLAKSSRNTYLSPESRKQAVILSKSIFMAKKMVEDGERDAEKVKKAMRELIESEPLTDIDYVEIVDVNTMKSLDVIKGEILCAIAVNVGGEARLIDNFMMKVD